MPLLTTAFINGLIGAETPPKETIAQQAKGFVDAFIPYVKGGTSNGIPINAAACDLPSAQSALEGGVASAFALGSGPAVANMLGQAILAFFKAGPESAFFTGATPGAAGIGAPLSTFMSGISSPVDKQKPAKAAVVSAITSWMGAGPGGLFITFPGSPPITAPII